MKQISQTQPVQCYYETTITETTVERAGLEGRGPRFPLSFYLENQVIVKMVGAWEVQMPIIWSR